MLDRSVIYIYGIISTGGLMKYVGKSKHPWRRFFEHRKSLGIPVHGLFLLQKVDPSGDDNLAERYWISKFGRKLLVNRTNGGNGAWAFSIPEEARRKIGKAISAALKRPGVLQRRTLAISLNKERGKKISAYLKRAWATPELRAKRVDALSRAAKDPDVRARHKAGMERALSNPQTRARIFSGLLRKNPNPEVIARRSESIRTFYKTEEGRRKIRIVAMAGLAERIRKGQARLKTEVGLLPALVNNILKDPMLTADKILEIKRYYNLAA